MLTDAYGNVTPWLSAERERACYLETGIKILQDLKHQSQAGMHLIGALEQTVLVQQLLEELDGPATVRENKRYD